LENWDSFIDIGSYLRDKGLVVTSPGGYGWHEPRSRQMVHKMVWKYGTLCSVCVKRKMFIFSLPDSLANDFEIVTKERKIELDTDE